MNNNNQHIPAGYNPSPLGPIPEDWEVKRLGDCFDICAGRDLITETYSPMQTVKHQYPIFSNSLENKGLYGYTSTPRHKANSITITGRGSLGHAEYRKQDFDAIIRLLVLTPKIEISCELITNYINFTQPFIYESTGVPQLTAPQIQNTKLLLPPYKEQLRIMDVLHNWDTAIAKQTTLIEKLTLRKRGLMQQLLTGKKRLKGVSGAWKEVRLGEIGTFFKGSGVPKDSITSEGHKCLTYGDLYTKYDYVISNVKSFIDDNTANNSTRIQYGDICFAGSGETKEDIGKCAAFIDDQYGYAGGDIIVFRAESFNPTTLSYILNSDSIIRQKSNMGQGHSVVHIYPYQLERITISIPSIEEQNAIASVLVNADREIELANEKLARLQEEKRGLMQVLLSGKKRINKTLWM